MKHMDIGSGSILAKIFAAENIVLDQNEKAETAYFDVKSRVLTVPVWDVSDDLYVMLLLHECAHALFTPPDAWCRAIKSKPEGHQKAFQAYLNVIEDARIDRMIQAKFPGARRNYIIGTREMNRMDFFGLSRLNGDYSSLKTIDKINIYFKATMYHDDLEIDYSIEDMNWINRVKGVDTFEEVVALAEELFEATMHELPVSYVSQIQIVVGDATGEETESNDGSKNNKPVLGGSETLDAIDKKKKDAAKSGKKKFGGSNSRPQRMNNGQILRIPDYPVDKVISPFNQNDAAYIKLKKKAVFQNIYNSGRSVVNYMVSAFERRKSARDYMRVQESKTGMLDTNNLYKIFYSDDVFLRKAIVPQCKNHGFIFLLDCSGSMSEIFETTLMQLFDLVTFCKKAGIPFEVYAFTDVTSALAKTLYRGAMGQFRLIEVANYRMKMSQIIDSFDAVRNIPLGGTPLSEALIGIVPIAERFREKYRVDKLNIISLTDGGCTLGNLYKAVVDPRTGVHYHTDTNICGSEDNTSAIYKAIKSRVNANIIAFFVVDNLNEVRYVLRDDAEKHEGFAKVDNIGGVDTCYYVEQRFLRYTNITETSSFDQRANITKNRVLTNKFIENVA